MERTKKEDIIEKLEKDSIKKKIRTNDEFNNIEFFDLVGNEKDMKGLIYFEKEGENIKKQDFEEDNKEEDLMFKSILEDLDKNILINIKKQEEDQRQNAINEILEILKYPHSDKNVRISSNPFNPLLQPKKISMVGRVFFSSNSNNDNNTTKENTN